MQEAFPSYNVSLFVFIQDSKGGDMKSILAGVYAKDWVNDFVEPDAGVMEEGKKTIDFLLKRCGYHAPRPKQLCMQWLLQGISTL